MVATSTMRPYIIHAVVVARRVAMSCERAVAADGDASASFLAPIVQHAGNRA